MTIAPGTRGGQTVFLALDWTREGMGSGPQGISTTDPRKNNKSLETCSTTTTTTSTTPTGTTTGRDGQGQEQHWTPSRLQQPQYPTRLRAPWDEFLPRGRLSTHGHAHTPSTRLRTQMILVADSIRTTTHHKYDRHHSPPM